MKNILIGKAGDEVCSLVPKMCNRHGLIAGVTGTGKTMTLRAMAEGFSSIGVPVLLADMKGDLSGICKPSCDPKFKDRAKSMGIKDYKYSGYPCAYWDIYKRNGIALNAPVREVGAFTLARILGLSKVQSGVLDLVFALAEDRAYRLDTLEDVKEIVRYMERSAEELFDQYGTFYPSTLGAIIRACIRIESQGGDKFFASNSTDITQYMMCEKDGKGLVNLVDCTELVRQPMMYSMFIMWVLDKLYNELPEVGDCDKPKFVVFFDEAHLLFEDTSKAVESKIAQIIRLVRSKGVGVYFISQSPSDIPEKVLSQLNNRVQHALRAFTPKEQRAVKVAAQTFRPNSEFDTEDVIMELGVGEALVSFLDENGIPTVVQRAKIVPPTSSLNILSGKERVDYTFNKCDLLWQAKRHGNGTETPKQYNDIPQPKKDPQNTNKTAKTTTPKYDYSAKPYMPSIGLGIAGSILDGIFKAL